MRKPFNAELNRDINTLKVLHARKQKREFKQLLDTIKYKHHISKATVYRELKKEIPGTYIKPEYFPPQRPITEREIAMVKELLLRNTPVMDIGRIMEAETGEKYNWDRVDSIRKIVDERMKEPELVLNTQTDASSPLSTCFGDKTRRLVEKTLKLDLMSPLSFITFEHNGREYRLSYNDATDIALIIANAIERENNTGKEYENRYEYMNMKLAHLYEAKLRLVTSPHAVTARELVMLKESFSDLEAIYLRKFHPNFMTLVLIARAFTPGIKLERIADYTTNFLRMFKMPDDAMNPKKIPEPVRQKAEVKRQNGMDGIYPGLGKIMKN